MPTITGRHILNMTEFYNSSQNAIVTKRKQTSKCLCTFDQVQYYPFGIQVCSMTFYLTGPAKHLTKLKGNLKVLKSNKQEVGQYTILNWTMIEEEYSNSMQVTHTKIKEHVNICCVLQYEKGQDLNLIICKYAK